jgi:membrane associated rhomboid family serine protease
LSAIFLGAVKNVKTFFISFLTLHFAYAFVVVVVAAAAVVALAVALMMSIILSKNHRVSQQREVLLCICSQNGLRSE